MTRALPMISIMLGACVNAQSARVVAPDKTMVTVAAGRTTEQGADSDDDVLWVGQVMVRQGLAPKVDGGVTLVRTPSSGPGTAPASAFAADGRVQLTPPEGRLAVTLGGAAGLYWSESSGGDGLDFELQGYTLAPSLHVGFDAAPTAELVLASRLMWMIPQGGGERTTLYNVSVGLRLHGREQTWAVHPELVYLGSLDDDESFLTLGFSVAAGN